MFQAWKLIACGGCVLTVALLGHGLCGTASGFGDKAPAPEVGKLVAGNNAFALQLLGQLTAAGPADGNVVCSPLSVSSALGLTYEGARGPTAEQIATVLQFGLDR